MVLALPYCGMLIFLGMGSGGSSYLDDMDWISNNSISILSHLLWIRARGICRSGDTIAVGISSGSDVFLTER